MPCRSVFRPRSRAPSTGSNWWSARSRSWKPSKALVEAISGPNLSAARLLALRGIGPESAAVPSLECFFRHFDNRRQLAAYAGLAPSPWQSGRVERIHGISKAGNGRLRTAMVELAWLCLPYQPASALAVWFRQRVRAERGRPQRIAIVALARKLLVAVNGGVIFPSVGEVIFLRCAGVRSGDRRVRRLLLWRSAPSPRLGDVEGCRHLVWVPHALACSPAWPQSSRRGDTGETDLPRVPEFKNFGKS